LLTSREFELQNLQHNLFRVFVFYSNNDPMRKKVLTNKPQPKQLEGDAADHPPDLKAKDYYLSMEGVLKFLYNYSIIDRFVRRKSLALILNSFKDYVDFSQFMRLLRLIAEEMYFDYPSINQTAKLKRMLEKLNLETPLNVDETKQGDLRRAQHNELEESEVQRASEQAVRRLQHGQPRRPRPALHQELQRRHQTDRQVRPRREEYPSLIQASPEPSRPSSSTRTSPSTSSA